MQLPIVEGPIKISPVLDPNFPEFDDPQYWKRRKKIAKQAVEYRNNPTKLPTIDYTNEDNQVWKEVLDKLEPLHKKHASKIYTDGIKLLNLPKDHVPQFQELSDKLYELHEYRLAPIEGMVYSRTFLSHFMRGIILTSQFVRHHSSPLYSPEPDTIHELAGHIPTFMNDKIVEFVQILAKWARNADTDELRMIETLYWFTVEAGLIREKGEVKVYGAALLTSVKDLTHAFSKEAIHHPFEINEVVNTKFNYSMVQNEFYVIEDLDQLIDETKKLIASFE